MSNCINEYTCTNPGNLPTVPGMLFLFSCCHYLKICRMLNFVGKQYKVKKEPKNLRFCIGL